MTQTTKVLSHLMKHGPISKREASMHYQIDHLPVVIRELRKAGHYINTEMHTDPNGVRYSRYRLNK